ncbi:hypothetical protein SeLEV6574_g07693 [Synchytrium endobioticum]|uniref:Uncharacterized protein n=1 Tax=Synchytrium endobioticum TaxID=286115 RepID=A0A507CGY5_9FUNG|nr:hypothetical protein SeLEV6574_g07693 [Synchytrium endobioticum]
MSCAPSAAKATATGPPSHICRKGPHAATRAPLHHSKNRDAASAIPLPLGTRRTPRSAPVSAPSAPPPPPADDMAATSEGPPRRPARASTNTSRATSTSSASTAHEDAPPAPAITALHVAAQAAAAAAWQTRACADSAFTSATQLRAALADLRAPRPHPGPLSRLASALVRHPVCAALGTRLARLAQQAPAVRLAVYVFGIMAAGPLALCASGTAVVATAAVGVSSIAVAVVAVLASSLLCAVLATALSASVVAGAVLYALTSAVPVLGTSLETALARAEETALAVLIEAKARMHILRRAVLIET